MFTFMNSPYSVPIMIVAIVMISSTVTKIAKYHYARNEQDDERAAAWEEKYRTENDELRRRVENLETIILELERKVNKI